MVIAHIHCPLVPERRDQWSASQTVASRPPEEWRERPARYPLITHAEPSIAFNRTHRFVRDHQIRQFMDFGRIAPAGSTGPATARSPGLLGSRAVNPARVRIRRPSTSATVMCCLRPDLVHYDSYAAIGLRLDVAHGASGRSCQERSSCRRCRPHSAAARRRQTRALQRKRSGSRPCTAPHFEGNRSNDPTSPASPAEDRRPASLPPDPLRHSRKDTAARSLNSSAASPAISTHQLQPA